jgi:hypothetical protein
MSSILLIILGVQVLTFGALGVMFLVEGNWRLGVAQLLLAAVQAIIYSGDL